ncbi:uncharacterized protein [Choristoneura fumiferana]|uniref:uncharacterized protein n=1 Tax=Choristoneura fumiferana TaxID=7141 RepID=UPI003D1564F1
MLLLLIALTSLGAAHASIGEDIGATGYMFNLAKHPAQTFNKVFKSASDFARFPDKSKQPQKCFTWDEVDHFDGEQDRPLYIVISHNVYDFTDFADLHPGGPAPLKKHAGQDATDLLCNTGLTDEVLAAVLLRFKVGYINKA